MTEDKNHTLLDSLLGPRQHGVAPKVRAAAETTQERE